MLHGPPRKFLLMRRPLAFLLLGFLAATSEAEIQPGVQSNPAGLPKEIVPRSYLIYLEPDIEARVIDGVESIEIEVLEPTNRIVLNALDTQITRARIEIDRQAEELSPQLDSNRQTVSFDLENRLPPGKYTLSIKFQSRILEEPHGLFIQPYEGALGTVEQLLAIVSQTADARRIFPCWDEPSFRAAFQLSIKTRRQNTVLSNMPVFAEQAFGLDQKIVVFEKTPSIGSDTVFLACGQLEWLEEEVAGIKLRIVTTPGKKAWGTYAMEVTEKLLPYFDTFFPASFPFPKLDQIAFPSGAAENLGGIFYDEEALLCDPESSYESVRQRIFLAIAGKIARQWYGDLVPITSPDAFWLNEAFASWIARKAADHFNPEWKIWLHATVEKEAAMSLDAGETTHAIQAPLAGAEQTTQAPDLITSQKSWLLLRMLETFAGDDPFRDGIRAYLGGRQSTDGTSEDFWASLERVAGKPIQKVVVGWINQPGFPLVKMTTQCVNGNRVISLDQVPFVFAEGGGSPSEWTIPVGIRTAMRSNEVQYALLDKLSKNFDLTGCAGVIQANAENVGYYRVLYEPALFNDLQKNVETLPESDRLNLVTDTWALAESGSLPASSYFDLLEKLGRDTSFAVWQSALGTDEMMGALRLVDRLEQGRPGREAYQKYICSLVGPKFRVLGWDKRAGEDLETQNYRAILIETLGFFGDRDVIDESIKRFEQYRENRSSLAPNLWSAVLSIVGRYSSQIVHHELLSMAENTRSTEEKRMYLRALGAALDPELARETLQYLVSDKVQPRDASLVFERVAAEGEHPDIAWSFAVDHLKEMRDRFGLPGQSRLLASIATGFTDNQRADEVLAFGQANFPPPALRELKKSLSTIRFRAKLKAKILPAIDDWIKAKS
jgi:aminopeptidase N